MFFFEKKKQKTFVRAVADSTNKSFLLLFFKKEVFLPFLGLIAAWWLIGAAFAIPPYLLPTPPAVARALWTQRNALFQGATTTAWETLLGILLGVALGVSSALLMAAFVGVRRWLLPVLLLSQAIPVFALAPLLVLWLGFGVASKAAMAAIVIFFPIMSAFYDGLSRVPQGWLDLARSMAAPGWRVLLFVRVPAALPALGSGLRVAACWAPLGAVIGEWVGASSGLGYLMLNANARVRTDVMFAAIAVLSAMTIGLWWATDHFVRRVLSWEPQ